MHRLYLVWLCLISIPKWSDFNELTDEETGKVYDISIPKWSDFN